MEKSEQSHIIDHLVTTRTEVASISRKLTRIEDAVRSLAKTETGFGTALLALGDELAEFRIEARQEFIRFHIGMQQVMNLLQDQTEPETEARVNRSEYRLTLSSKHQSLGFSALVPSQQPTR